MAEKYNTDADITELIRCAKENETEEKLEAAIKKVAFRIELHIYIFKCMHCLLCVSSFVEFAADLLNQSSSGDRVSHEIHASRQNARKGCLIFSRHYLIVC